MPSRPWTVAAAAMGEFAGRKWGGHSGARWAGGAAGRLGADASPPSSPPPLLSPSELRDRLVLNLYMLRGRAHEGALVAARVSPDAATPPPDPAGLAPPPTPADRAEAALFAPVARMLDAVKAAEAEGRTGPAGARRAAASAAAARAQLGLWSRQLANERRALAAARARYAADVGRMASMGAPTAAPTTARLLARLWAPTADAVRSEQRAILAGVPGTDRSRYGPRLLLLDADLLAVLALHTALAHCLAAPGRGAPASGGRAPSPAKARAAGTARFTPLALAVGRAVRDQVRLERLAGAVRGESARAADLAALYASVRSSGPLTPAREKQLLARFAASASDGGGASAHDGFEARLAALAPDPPTTPRARNAAAAAVRDAAAALDEGDVWGADIEGKVGAALLMLLANSATVPVPTRGADGRPLPGAAPPPLEPAFSHDNKGARAKGGVRRVGLFRLHDEVWRQATGSDRARSALEPAHLPMLVPPLPWRTHDSGGYLASRHCVMRVKDGRTQRALLRAADAAPPAGLSQVYDALNALGEVPWRINTVVLDAVEAAVAAGGGVCGLPPAAGEPPVRAPGFTARRPPPPWPPSPPGAPLAPPPGQLMLTAETADERAARARANSAARKRNRERHSLRCDLDLKLAVAREFRQDKFYFPHSMDFRGRAYPMHPHLNHLGSDVCRGVLTFGEAIPLGEDGYDHLLLQVSASVGGLPAKRPLSDRLAYASDRIADIHATADDPSSSTWWHEADDPWQLLATCIEIRDADASGDPATFRSALPVRMDGSCNGLQHYAALGRDAAGGKAVNLVPAAAPADVYSDIAAAVAARVAADAAAGVPEAVALSGCVDRKLVKQTVMTSVYGVTFFGARDQVAARLRERGWAPDADATFRASAYAAGVTLRGIGDLFGSARAIMAWLADAASAVAATGSVVTWHTPLGLPCSQPYRASKARAVQTVAQKLILEGDAARRGAAPALRRRQRAAFPPNFIHALDSTHMMMTASACRKQGVAFAGVHDSFWTHAGTATRLASILREAFIDLHSQPLLEDLAADFRAAHPALAFSPVPARGELDLDGVRESKYFFA